METGTFLNNLKRAASDALLTAKGITPDYVTSTHEHEDALEQSMKWLSRMGFSDLQTPSVFVNGKLFHIQVIFPDNLSPFH